MYSGKAVVFGMPAYNEEVNVASAVESFLAHDAVDEVVVVDNNSTDATAERAEEAGAIVVNESKQGYGHACQRALAEANDRGGIIGLVEPDGTFTARDVSKLLAYLDDFDFVVGTRTAPELIWQGANMGAFLRWGNWFVAKLLQVLHNTPSLTDVGCTFRVMNSEAYTKIKDDFTVGGSHFSPEMLIRVAQNDVSMIEIPVNYRPRRGKSKITGEFVPAFELGLVMTSFILTECVRSSQ